MESRVFEANAGGTCSAMNGLRTDPHRLAPEFTHPSVATASDLQSAFPIVVQYALGSLSPDDRGKITAALQQSNHVSEINLDLYRPPSEIESQIMQGAFPLPEAKTLYFLIHC